MERDRDVARVPVSAVAERCEMLPGARYVRFDSFDSGYSNGWDLASAMHPPDDPRVRHERQPLPVAHGAPLRLYSPTKLGYKMTKYLVSMTFTADRPGGYWRTRGIRGWGRVIVRAVVNEPSLRTIWAGAAVLGLVGYAAARFRRWLVLPALALIAVAVWMQLGDLLDHTWAAIMQEAGLWYVGQAGAAAALAVILCVVGLAPRRAP